jgi:hypothetical protein
VGEDMGDAATESLIELARTDPMSKEVIEELMNHPNIYHELRLRQPDIYIEEISDYTTLQEAPDGTVSASMSWDIKTGDLKIKKLHFDKTGWAVSGYEVVPGINLKRITILCDKDAGQLYVQDNMLNTLSLASDYVKSINIPGKYVSYVLQALKLVKPQYEKPAGLEVRAINGYLKLPDRKDMFLQNHTAKILAGTLVRGTDKAALMANFHKLWPLLSQKQRTDVIASLGVPLRNIIIEQSNLEYRLCYMVSYGPTTLGKSWGYLQALKLWWGLFLKKMNGLFSGNMIESSFRFTDAMDSTNLPFYVDESTSAAQKMQDAIKAAAMQGITARGHADQSMTIKRLRATLMTTAQSNVFIGGKSYSDDLAVDMRFYGNRYVAGKPDEIDDPAILKAQDEWVANCKEGGLVYLLLKEHQLDELVTWVIEFEQIARGDTALSGLMLGLRLLGIERPEYTDAMLWDRGSDEMQGMRDYDLIIADSQRAERGKAGNFPDNFAKDMETRLKIEEGWLYLNNSYLAWVNSNKSHPLCGRFGAISDLAQLQGLVVTGSVTPLVTQEVYNRDARTRIGGKLCCFAKIPLEIDTQRNISVTQRVTDIIRERRDNVTLVTQDILTTKEIPLNDLSSHKGDTKTELRNTPQNTITTEKHCDPPLITFLKNQGGQATREETEAMFGPTAWELIEQYERTGDVFKPRQGIVRLVRPTEVSE